MTETIQNCKFFLLRYVPDAVKNEFVNIAVVLLQPEGPPQLRFAQDWSRVRVLDPRADTELLDAFREELASELGNESSRERMLRMLTGSFSNILQISEYKACLTAEPAREADDLARIYLEAPRRRPSREKGPRQQIWQSMRKAFIKAGVWKLIWADIPASRYTRAGDPLEIDCGYRAKATVKMFHAVSLRNEVTAAKVLAFTYPELAAGIRRVEGAEAHLTAIIEDGLKQEEDDQIGFALETLKQQSIQVATVSGLPELAAIAAKEISELPKSP